jgi:hypothetical protein
VKLNSFASFTRIIDAENSGAVIAYNTNDTMTVSVNGTSGFKNVIFSVWSASYPLGSTVMIGITWVENVGLTMTVNGVDAGFTAATGTRLLFDTLYIGQRSNNSSYANADIDFNALIPSALTTPQILAVYNQLVAND